MFFENKLKENVIFDRWNAGYSLSQNPNMNMSDFYV